jgi:hypothetical protein
VKRWRAHDAEKILGTLNGFDRLVFRGHLRRIVYALGMTLFLNVRRVWFREFKDFACQTTDRLKKVSLEAVEKIGRPIVLVRSSAADKESIAREIAREDRVTEGLVALLKCTEPCKTFVLGSNRKTGGNCLPRPPAGDPELLDSMQESRGPT